MADVRVFKRAELPFEPYGGPPGESRLARVIGPEESTTMGAGVATFDGTSIEWTVRYDEVIFGFEGTTRIRVGGTAYEAGPGDVIWIPEGTPLHYEGDRATCFYALAPVDWRERGGG